MFFVYNFIICDIVEPFGFPPQGSCHAVTDWCGLVQAPYSLIINQLQLFHLIRRLNAAIFSRGRRHCFTPATLFQLKCKGLNEICTTTQSFKTLQNIFDYWFIWCRTAAFRNY